MNSSGRDSGLHFLTTIKLNMLLLTGHIVDLWVMGSYGDLFHRIHL